MDSKVITKSAFPKTPMKMLAILFLMTLLAMLPLNGCYTEEYTKGYYSGHADGFNEGYAEGYTKGWVDCMKQCQPTLPPPLTRRVVVRMSRGLAHEV